MKARFGAVLVLLAGAPAAAADFPLATAVHFNTVCARCHEGECSGRLSFNLDHQASSNHVVRYSGQVSADELRDLHALLAYMKKSCGYHPLAVAVPADGIWPAARVAPLRSPAGDAYFIPLGVLPPGNHRATLQVDGGAEYAAEVVSDVFEITAHRGSAADRADFAFRVDRQGLHYLRLQFGKPATLIELRVTSSP